MPGLYHSIVSTFATTNPKPESVILGFASASRRFVHRGATHEIGPARCQFNASCTRSPDLRHPHGEAFNDHICVEGLEDIPRQQGMVHAGVLVLLELREVLLPDVDHADGFAAISRCTMALSELRDSLGCVQVTWSRVWKSWRRAKL